MPRNRPLFSLGLRTCGLSLLVLAMPVLAAASGDPVDAAWILQKLARPLPVSTAFVEVRSSPMLKEPLKLVGRYSRPDAETLVREVTSPYHETATLRDGRASLQREGKPERSFDMARAPELAGLKNVLGAVLAGDGAALHRQFAITTTGVRQAWQMTLVPTDAEMAARVKSLQLFGRGAELRCIQTQPVRGEVQRTLLAGAAGQAAQAGPGTDLAALCQGQPG